MTVKGQLSFWGISFLATGLFLWLLGDILLPFVAGLVLAYFLDPVADWMETIGIPRIVAALTIVLFSVLCFAVLLFFLLPVLGDQIASFMQDLPGYAKTLTQLFNNAAPEWLKKALLKSGTGIPNSLGDVATEAARWLAALITSIWSGGLALVNTISLLVVTPIVLFYLLNDWDRMVAIIDGWVPRDHLETVRGLARQIDRAMAGFIRGQGTVCLVLGAFYAVALVAVGLNFGLLIGLLAGLLSFIPYVGSIIGGVLSIGMALAQFWPDWVNVLIVAGIFAAGQFVEGNFLSPKLVGNRIGLHPVWLMFALFAVGYLFGFVGLLLAVPIAAAIGVLVRFGLSQYLQSKMYKGSSKKSSKKPAAGGAKTGQET